MRIIVLASLLIVALPGMLRAEIVRWTDERGVTHYSEGLDTVPERYRSSAVPLGMRNQPASAGSERPVIRPEGEIFRFTPGRHIHIDVRINDSVSARLILDTGAGQTMISPHILAAAGVPLGQGRTVRRRGLAEGVYVEAIRVSVQSIAVGNARVERMAVNAYDMGSRDAEGQVFARQHRQLMLAAGAELLPLVVPPGTLKPDPRNLEPLVAMLPK